MLRLVQALFAVVFFCGANESIWAGQIYWSEVGATAVTIKRANLDGSNVHPLALGNGVTARDISLDLSAGKLYGTGMSAVIGRSNLDGSGLESVVDNVGISEWGLDLDRVNNFVYWTDRDASAIFRAGLDGSNPTKILYSAQPRGIRVDPIGGKIYWADSGDRGAEAVFSANLDGSNKQTIATGFRPSFVDLDLIHGYIYWTDTEGVGKINRTNLDGTGTQTLLSGLSRPTGIAIDVEGNSIYWAASGVGPGTGSIGRSNLDGSGLQTLVAGLDDPSGIALDLRPDSAIAPEPASISLLALGSIAAWFFVRHRENQLMGLAG